MTEKNISQDTTSNTAELEAANTLFRAAQEGDDEAKAQLYTQYKDKIYSYVYRRTGNSQLAEDLTAQVFLKMYENLKPEFQLESSIIGWLYRVAHNEVIDYYRKRDSRENVSLDESVHKKEDSADPALVVERNEREALLLEALDLLRVHSTAQAQVLECRFLLGLSIRETAIEMNRTETAIKVLQHRAITTIQRKVKSLFQYSDE